MSEAIRIGIVGARFAARFHWEGYRRVYGTPVQVVGVTSQSPESREEFARQHGIEAFASFDELCEAVDVVDLCTPGSTHEPLAVRALRRGKHVVVEKPFTGYYGPGTPDFRGDAFSKEVMLREAMASSIGSWWLPGRPENRSAMRRIGCMLPQSKRSGRSW